MTMTPLQMLAHKRAGKIITIGLPEGRDIRLTTYLNSWRRLRTMDPKTQVANWDWFPVSAGEILHRIHQSVDDRINWKAGVTFASFEPKGKHFNRVQAKLESLYAKGLITHECRWCGARLPRYTPHYARFCDASCRQSCFN